MSNTHRLRILCQNLWHGLDHTRPFVMFPLELPWISRRRKQATLKALRSLRSETGSGAPATSLDVFCLQELNPLNRDLRRLRAELDMQGEGFEINVGLRLGELSYPFFLQEGLGTLWRGDWTQTQATRHVLTGQAPDFEIPILRKRVTLQVGERRGALFVSGRWGGVEICVVNLHIHHGPWATGQTNRREVELARIREILDRDYATADLVFLVGDFNSERGLPEFDALIDQHGFRELSLEDGQRVVTWDPVGNPLCARNAALNEEGGAAKAWDADRHQFDHVLLRTRNGARAPVRTSCRRVLDTDAFGAFASDHYGLVVDMEWDGAPGV